MAFDLLDRPALYIPVKWPGLAIGDQGEAVATEHEVEVQVEILDNEAIKAWVAPRKPADGETAEQTSAIEVASFREVAKGWRKVVAKGRAVPFTDENIAKLLAWPGFGTAFGQAYVDAWNGKVATREGNSEGSGANGRTVEPTAATPAVPMSAS